MLWEAPLQSFKIQMEIFQLYNWKMENISGYGHKEDLDNEQFFRDFATSPDGNLYVPRAENLDFENPTDANKDNTYELLF